MEHRKRVSRACDECRRLKEKCEGGVPCRRCSHLQRPCECRGPTPRPREFRPYVPREASRRPDFTELIERSKHMERILQRTMEGISLDTKNLANIADRLETDHQSRSRASAGPRDLEGLEIDDEACTMQPVGDTTTHFSGEFSYWNFSMRIKSHIESRIQEPESREENRQDDDYASAFPRAHQLRPEHNHLSAAISTFPPSHISSFLVRIFFKYAESYLFFIEEGWVLEKLALLHTKPESLTQGGGEVTVSILLTVLAIGTQYAHLERAKGPGNTSTSGLSEEEIGTTFYQQAIRLLPEIIEISSLESVQACLLFGYYFLPIDASGLGFIYINLAIRLGIQNGMHRKCSNNAFNSSVIETRNRVWWTTYVLERKISIFHGRPISVSRVNIDASLPLHQDNSQSEDWRRRISYTRVSVQLVHLLEDLFHEINLLRNCPRQEIPAIVSRLVAKKGELTTWWQSLPPDAVDVNAQQNPTQFRSAMHLRLEYCLVRMFVGRPFLLKRETQDSTASPSVPENSPGTNEESTRKPVSSREELISDCIQAATEALDICQQLRSSGIGLARASYPEYSACRASLLVLIAYSIRNFSEKFRKSLCEGLDMIREMSAAGESARSEVSLIESLERALARLHAGARQHGSSHDQVHVVSDYEAFRNWGAKLAGTSVSDTTPAAPDPPASQEEADSASGWPAELDFQPNVELFSGYDLAADPLVELSIFGTENLSPSLGWPTYTEAEVLGRFIGGPHGGNWAP
ncbi:fungal-specific transcription factor [Ilyonectria robusta]|uniref:fungal-specific transcription factor n=1 Tax=Ilyonectria robusta TaxID=1079257 RepID=UPI001E8CC056|nr:fungal-specific transcription factor [Ilyonectria robusta]KAH8672222.1 fungal-specific transcription factor [Ilyonectria robusta]